MEIKIPEIAIRMHVILLCRGGCWFWLWKG